MLANCAEAELSIPELDTFYPPEHPLRQQLGNVISPGLPLVSSIYISLSRQPFAPIPIIPTFFFATLPFMGEFANSMWVCKSLSMRTHTSAGSYVGMAPYTGGENPLTITVCYIYIYKKPFSNIVHLFHLPLSHRNTVQPPILIFSLSIHIHLYLTKNCI